MAEIVVSIVINCIPAMIGCALKVGAQLCKCCCPVDDDLTDGGSQVISEGVGVVAEVVGSL